jgi:hypothetical protein
MTSSYWLYVPQAIGLGDRLAAHGACERRLRSGQHVVAEVARLPAFRTIGPVRGDDRPPVQALDGFIFEDDCADGM